VVSGLVFFFSRPSPGRSIPLDKTESSIQVSIRRTLDDGEPVNAEVLALVPARSGSKSVRDKNVYPLAGHPLLGWSIAAARKSALIDRVLLTTDSPTYAAVGDTYGAEVPFLRPAALATDDALDNSFVEHALNWLVDNGGEPELLINLRPTTPLRRPEVIDKAIEQFRASEGFTALRSVHEMSESAIKTFEIINDLLRPMGSPDGMVDDVNLPRQQYPSTYDANGYVDILSTEVIRSSDTLYGDRVVPFITERTLEIDTPADIEYLEYLVELNPDLVESLFT